ncbi:MAG: MFS transporter, partial [Lacisediminihabitans sp.]
MTAEQVGVGSAATPGLFVEPQKLVSGAWIALFATAWLGIWMAQLTPIQLLLPTQVEQVNARLGSTDWVANVVAFGVVSGIAGVCALVAFPLTGALSDRTTSRFGRRRPWILGGAVLFALGLILLGAQQSMVGIGVFWSLSLTGFCVLSASLTAVISDQVPVRQRGQDMRAFVAAGARQEPGQQDRCNQPGKGRDLQRRRRAAHRQ